MSRPSHKPRNYHTKKIWQCKKKNWKLKTACKTKVTADIDIFTTSGMVTEKLCNLSKITSRQHTWMKEEEPIQPVQMNESQKNTNKTLATQSSTMTWRLKGRSKSTSSSPRYAFLKVNQQTQAATRHTDPDIKTVLQTRSERDKPQPHKET